MFSKFCTNRGFVSDVLYYNMMMKDWSVCCSDDTLSHSWGVPSWISGFTSSVCLQVMSLLTPGAVSSQPQPDFSSSPLHGAMDSSSSSSTSAVCSHTSADAAARTGDAQPYCPPTYGTSSYSMDPVASYQYSQSESQPPNAHASVERS